MKQFLKYVLATVVGIIVTGIVLAFFSVVSLVGMASMSAGGKVEDNSVLVIKLYGQINERAENNPFSSFLGKNGEDNGLNDILTAIKRAETEDNIKGIYLEGGTFAGATPAMLQEIRDALVNFKKTGKFIVAYGDEYSQGSYYVSSVADKVYLNPEGMLEWAGMANSITFFKEALDKAGVSMQVVKVGTYKSAVEPFMLTEASEPNKEQTITYLTEIWKQMLDDVAKSRKMSADQLNAIADLGINFADPKEYKKHNLIDKLIYADEVPGIISKLMGVEDNDYNTITAATLASIDSSEPKGTSGNIVAVYYAYGSIINEENPSSFGGGHDIVMNKVVDDLKSLAEDEDVKAVVLRVNSPGGSAYASEQIWRQVMNIKSKKPIIVSMGGYAASGGYYISCAADWIVAEPTTLTGSIGIFAQIPEASELINKKIGVHETTIKTNEYADFDIPNFFRPLTEGEKERLQAHVNRGYEVFTKRCADGRHLSQDSIKAIGEGRVWTGAHAKKIGLVDQLGSLEDAIAVAKKKAKIDECSIINYPAEASMFESLMDNASGDTYADRKMKAALGEYYDMFNDVMDIKNKSGVQASIPFRMNFNL